MYKEMTVIGMFILKINWFTKISFDNLFILSNDKVYVDPKR